MSPISSASRVFIGREDVWGGAVAAGRWRRLPVTPPTPTSTVAQILDEGMRGFAAKDFASYPGVGSCEVPLEGLFYPVELGYILLTMLGSVTTSGAAAPYKHVFGLAPVPPSLQVRDLLYDGAFFRGKQYGGLLASGGTITFNRAEGAIGFTVTLVGKMAENVTTEPAEVPADATIEPFIGWRTLVSIGAADHSDTVAALPTPTATSFGFVEAGITADQFKDHVLKFTSGTNDGMQRKIVSNTASATVDAQTDTVTVTVEPALQAAPSSGDSFEIYNPLGELISCTLTFSRDVALIHSGQNTQQPSAGYSHILELTGEIVVDYRVPEHYEWHQEGKVQRLEIGVMHPRTPGVEMGIVIPKMSWLEGPTAIDRGAANVRLTWPLRGIFDSGIASPIRITLFNDHSSYAT